MSLLSQLAKVALDVVVTPIAIIEDVVTMGGILNDKDEPATLKHLASTVEDVLDIPRSIDNGLI